MEMAIDALFGVYLQPSHAGAYVILFCVPFLAPGCRSLGAMAVVLGGTSLVLLFEAKREMDNAPGGAVLVAVFALVFLSVACQGLWAGLATRAALLGLRRYEWPFSAKFVLILAGFLLLPLASAAMIWHEEWVRRPPDAACLERLHPIEVQGAVFYLPSAPFFAVWDSSTSLHLFEFNQSMREFCARNGGSGKPRPAVMFTVDTKPAYRPHNPLLQRYCSSVKSGWGKDFCSLGYPPKAESIDDVKVYSTEEFDYRGMVGREGSYEGFWEWRGQVLSTGLGLERRRVGNFDYYEAVGQSSSRTYWVAADGGWRNPAGEPFTLACFKTPPADTLGCTTAYRWRSGPTISYTFRAPRPYLEAAARRTDWRVQGMLEELAEAGR